MLNSQLMQRSNPPRFGTPTQMKSYALDSNTNLWKKLIHFSQFSERRSIVCCQVQFPAVVRALNDLGDEQHAEAQDEKFAPYRDIEKHGIIGRAWGDAMTSSPNHGPSSLRFWAGAPL